MRIEGILFIVTLLVFVLIVISCYILDNWIRVKDVCYRVEKRMHLQGLERNKIAAIFMAVLRRISKY